LSAPVEPRVFCLADAIDRLQTHDAIEELSSLHGVSAFIVKFERAGDALARPAAMTAIRSLERLACPSIAVAGVPQEGASRELLERFDVVVEREAELPSLVEACQRHPLAALALVQLLRLNEGLSVHDGLVAESLVYSTLQAGPEFADWLASRGRRAPRPAVARPAVRILREPGDAGCERLHLSLDRPEKRNAFSSEMRDALVEGLHVALADPDIEEIVLDGRGPAFCSGGDLDEFGSLPDPATAHAIRSTRNAARLLAACGERVRAYLHGACVGAGIELPAFARRVVAHRDAFFQLPENQLGLVPGAGGTVSIPRRIGRQRTAWLALSGARLGAETALAWGLVDRVQDGSGVAA
jgi:enoyl-CoA hydratase